MGWVPAGCCGARSVLSPCGARGHRSVGGRVPSGAVRRCALSQRATPPAVPRRRGGQRGKSGEPAEPCASPSPTCQLLTEGSHLDALRVEQVGTGAAPRAGCWHQLPARFCRCFSRCFADIHEFYDFTLRSTPLQPPSPEARRGTDQQQPGASKPSSAVSRGKPQSLPEVRATPARCCRARPCTLPHWGVGRGTGGCWPPQPSLHPGCVRTSCVTAALVTAAASLLHPR